MKMSSSFLSVFPARKFIPVAAALLVALTFPAYAADMHKGPVAKFDKNGQLLLPEGYRTWVFVGATVTPNDMNNGKADFPEFHYVYINPSSYWEYAKTGKFPDGTVMVKDLVSVGSKKAPSGNGYFPGTYNGVAASVKDSKRFPKEPGHWAYFSFMGKGGVKLSTAKAQPTASCNTCHQKNAAEDWVFTQYYPVLRAAKAKK
jgi:hypothetical protein